MNADVSIWSKLSRVVIALLLAAGVLAVVVWYRPLLMQNQRMRQELMSLDNKIQHEEAVNRSLKASIDAMRDPKTVERLAREKLSYARTGETVFRFEAPVTHAPAVPPPSRPQPQP